MGSPGSPVVEAGVGPAAAAAPVVYREHPAPASLGSHVACLWERTHGASVIVPDGCVDAIWTGERVIVAGPSTRGFHSAAPEPGTCKVGIRFRVGAAAAVLGLPARDLLDGSPDLADLWPEARTLGDRCGEAGSVAGIAAALVDVVTPRVRDADPVDPVIAGAVDGLVGPRSRVDGLDVGLSTRHLRRRFETEVGYSPKMLVRVLRLQRFLSAAGRGLTLADVAHIVGYTDHAHLSRDCRALTGSSPSELLAADVPVTGDPHVRGARARSRPTD